jgi:hypothetical protein
LYPPTLALSMFMKQALHKDRSCQRAVNDWAAQRVAEGLLDWASALSPGDTKTSSGAVIAQAPFEA